MSNCPYLRPRRGHAAENIRNSNNRLPESPKQPAKVISNQDKGKQKVVEDMHPEITVSKSPKAKPKVSPPKGEPKSILKTPAKGKPVEKPKGQLNVQSSSNHMPPKAKQAQN